MSKSPVKLKDGIIKQNVVLMSGLFAGPVIGAATTWERSLALCFVFSLVTILSVGLCRLLPKKITFAVRIVLYALISTVVYIPVMLLAGLIFPSELLDSIALYLILSVTNPLIMSKTESRFFLRPNLMMYKDVLGFVLGFDLSCILVGSIRDIFTDQMIANMIVKIPLQLPAMDKMYCGFILVGILAGLSRFIYTKIVKKKHKKAN
ncbi:MAG: hypothetical protein HDT44_05335 [Ruminococcaceae bacterium]|nr:hypothetical protein [Oscillospiraceae bacterium]